MALGMNGLDAINGKEGTLTVTVDGKVQELGMCKTASAKVEKIKKEIKSVGARMNKHKTVGMNGTGEMVLHTMYPSFKKLLDEYLKTGKDFYFNLTFTNEDPASPAGKQIVTVQNCLFDEVTLAELNADDETLEDTLPFTHEGWAFAQHYNEGINIT